VLGGIAAEAAGPTSAFRLAAFLSLVTAAGATAYGLWLAPRVRPAIVRADRA
jgi:hypothetical protein